MKSAPASFIMLLFLVSAEAQQYDAQWVLAPNPSIVDFRNDTVTNATMSGFFNITGTSADICDSSGNLLFATNGVSIFDQNGDILNNGNGLSPCAYTTEEASNGLGIPQAALFLPAPGNKYLYYLIHFSADTLLRPNKLYYSLVNYENGLGNVIKKNVIFCQSLFQGGGMTACKHANGRDYWIIMGGLDDSSFYKFLLTPDTILGPYIQNIGPAYPGPYDVAYSKFSEDGSKYVTGCFAGLITVMDFDRCSGEFSNPLTIFNNASGNPDTLISGCVSVEFSPNRRFLYVSDVINLNQYDLWSPNIQDSVELYRADSTDFWQIDMLQIAPNGKLYASTWNGGFYYLHVINYPNEKGDSCDFVYSGYYTLTEDDVNLPNMINYDLGPLSIYQAGAGNDTTLCSTDTNALLIGLPPIAGIIYAWQPAAGITDTTQAQQLVKPSQSTWYYLTLTDTTIQYSCQSREDSVYIGVVKCVNGIQNIAEGVEKLSGYPNPASNYLIISTDASAIGAQLEILNLMGEQVAKYIITNAQYSEGVLTDKLPVANLTQGLYLLKISDSKGNVGVGRFVKE